MASESVGKTRMVWQTSNLYFFLHTVKEIMSLLYLCSFAFIGRAVLWGLSAPHFIFFLLFKPQSLPHSSRLPFDEASWRKFHLESATVNDLGSNDAVESSAACMCPSTVWRRLISSEWSGAFFSCRPWRALWCNGLLVGTLYSTCHPGMLCRTTVFFSCQDSKSLCFLPAIEQEFSPMQR